MVDSHLVCMCVWHFNIRSGFLEARAVEGRACVLDSKTSENDGCGFEPTPFRTGA